MQAASESLCKRDEQWAETHAFRVGQTPDGNTVFMMVLVNPHEGEVLQLCSHRVVGWSDASPGLFSLRSVQVAPI